MAIDFSKPATTDNYSTVFVPGIVASTVALAQWLDSANTTITGTPPTFAKRYNRTATLFDEFNGTAWAELPLGYLKLAGGALTGPLNVGAGANGYLTANPGNAANTGYVAFYPASGARQGYIGFSSTTAALDTGTIPFVMGFANFSGNVTAVSFTGAGTGLTGTAAGLSIGGSATNQSGGTVNATTATFSSTVTMGSTLTMTAANAGIEMGSSAASNTPFIDFHTQNRASDFDVRLIASGGGAGDGLGVLAINAASVTSTLFIGGLTGNASSASNVAGSGAATVATLTATGVLKGNSGAKGYGAITTTVTTGTPTGGTSGDFVLVY